MKKRSIAVLLAVLMTLSLLAGCGSSTASQTTTAAAASSETAAASAETQASAGTRNLTVPSSSTLSTLDSTVASNSVDMTVIRSVGEGLYRDSKDGIVLSLASKDDVSADGLTHTFTIRDDAKWSNGDPITAKDFEYSWKRLANPDTGAEYASMLETARIKNAADVTSGAKGLDELGVKATDDKTLVVECDSYIPYFSDLLILPCFFPESEAFVTSQGDQYGMTKDNVLYSGVFTVTDWEMGSDTVVLSKNQNFYDQSLSNLDTLTYQTITETQAGMMAYESDQLDVLNITGDALDQYADSADIHYVNNATLYYLQPNLQNQYLANKNLRLALAAALNREAICTDILKDGSKPAGYIVVSNFARNDQGVDFRDVANKTYQPYDLTQARSYWDAALQELGTDSVSIELLYDDSASIPEIAQYMQSTLQDALPGLTITMQVQPSKNRRELMAQGDFDIALTRWGSDYNDPSTFMDLFVTDASFNYGGYSSAEYDSLIAKASKDDIMKTDARFQDYIQAEGTILNEAGIIPVYEVGRAYLVRAGVHVDFTVDSGYMYQYASMD